MTNRMVEIGRLGSSVLVSAAASSLRGGAIDAFHSRRIWKWIMAFSNFRNLETRVIINDCRGFGALNVKGKINFHGDWPNKFVGPIRNFDPIIYRNVLSSTVLYDCWQWHAPIQSELNNSFIKFEFHSVRLINKTNYFLSLYFSQIHSNSAYLVQTLNFSRASAVTEVFIYIT